MEKNAPKTGIGYPAGKLTVTQAAAGGKAGYTVWACQCGNTILLDTRCLQSSNRSGYTGVYPKSPQVWGTHGIRIFLWKGTQEMYE